MRWPPVLANDMLPAGEDSGEEGFTVPRRDNASLRGAADFPTATTQDVERHG